MRTPLIAILFLILSSPAHAQKGVGSSAGESAAVKDGIYEIYELRGAFSPTDNVCHPDVVRAPGEFGPARPGISPAIIWNGVFLTVKTPAGMTEIWEPGCSSQSVIQVGEFVGKPGLPGTDPDHQHFEYAGRSVPFATETSADIPSSCWEMRKDIYKEYSLEDWARHDHCTELKRRAYLAQPQGPPKEGRKFRPFFVRVKNGFLEVPERGEKP